MKAWISFSPSRTEMGKKVLSYPDHHGRSVEGVIRQIAASTITVKYS